MSKRIQVLPYDSHRHNAVDKEEPLIRQALGDRCVAIDHVGSTAVYVKC